MKDLMKNNEIRRPEVARLADQLQRKNPTWSDQRARSEAKARITAPATPQTKEK